MVLLKARCPWQMLEKGLALMGSFVTGTVWLASLSVSMLLFLFQSFVSLPVKSHFN